MVFENRNIWTVENLTTLERNQVVNSLFLHVLLVFPLSEDYVAFSVTVSKIYGNNGQAHSAYNNGACKSAAEHLSRCYSCKQTYVNISIHQRVFFDFTTSAQKKSDMNLYLKSAISRYSKKIKAGATYMHCQIRFWQVLLFSEDQAITKDVMDRIARRKKNCKQSHAQMHYVIDSPSPLLDLISKIKKGLSFSLSYFF